MEEQQIVEEPTQKKIRRRKKLLYQNILKQMEFYFSDANLNKDRFLAQLLQEDPYIDLAVFLTFNRISILTDNIKDLANALRMSETLSLSDDNAKVRRITSVKVKEDQDECTIYVERLPADTEHEWLIQIFSKFGNVDYVSIPRYKHNKMIKGFAFIEYDKRESASKALEYFEFIGCKLPLQMPPEQLASIATFEHENMSKIDEFLPIKVEKVNDTEGSDSKDKTSVKNVDEKRMKDLNASTNKSIDQIIDDENTDQNKNSDVPKIKIKIETSPKRKETETHEITAKKKGKTNVDEKNESTDKSGDECKDDENTDKSKNYVGCKVEAIVSLSKRKEIDSDEDAVKKKLKIEHEVAEKQNEVLVKTEDLSDIVEGSETQKRKNKRKKSKRKKNRMDLKQIGLKVLSKKEWKQLRNKYLNLQKQKMKNLKEQLYRSRFGNVAQYNDPTRNTLKVEKNEEKSEPRFKYTPGCIIQVLFPETCLDSKKLKAEIKTQAGVEYIDIMNDFTVGYIRFSNNENCQTFLESSFNWSMKILEGKEEKEYWDKILQERELKLQKGNSKKQRGREKLLRKAEKELGKHIRFENVE